MCHCTPGGTLRETWFPGGSSPGHCLTCHVRPHPTVLVSATPAPGTLRPVFSWYLRPGEVQHPPRWEGAFSGTQLHAPGLSVPLEHTEGFSFPESSPGPYVPCRCSRKTSPILNHITIGSSHTCQHLFLQHGEHG